MIDLGIEPCEVSAGVTRVVTLRLANSSHRVLTNIIVGLEVPPELGLEQGLLSFSVPRLLPEAMYDHALRIRPTSPGRHTVRVRNLSCRNGDGRPHRVRGRSIELVVHALDTVVASRADPSDSRASQPRKRQSVFVSYRRDDTKLMIAGLVRDLGRRKALRRVDLFLDLTEISPGAEWSRVLDSELLTCDALVAVIGPSWLTPRLRHPGDVVRREIATALQRRVPVLPLLVEAPMPAAADLLPDLLGLTARQALVLDLGRYGACLADLANTLAKVLAAPSDAASSEDGQPGADADLT